MPRICLVVLVIVGFVVSGCALPPSVNANSSDMGDSDSGY